MLRQEDCKFKTSLGYIVRLCLKNNKQQQKIVLTRHRWLTPVVLTTWEAEIRNFMVLGQLGKEGRFQGPFSAGKAGHGGAHLLSPLCRKHSFLR
jgi:hypothetical protein